MARPKNVLANKYHLFKGDETKSKSPKQLPWEWARQVATQVEKPQSISEQIYISGSVSTSNESKPATAWNLR